MQVQIPELSTVETRAIRGSYPSIEHLEAGNVGAWLQERKDQLLARARNGRSEMNLAKLLTLSATAVGAVCYAVSPLAPIGALIAGVGYVWTVAQDMNESHQFAPLPFVRGDFLEFVSAMGDRESREQYLASSDPVVELMYHLEPMDRYEFGMLQGNTHTIASYLSQVEPGKKFYAYRWVLTCFINLRGSFPSMEDLKNHVADVGGNPTINAVAVAAIQEHDANQTAVMTGLPPVKTVMLAQPNIVSLPAAGGGNESPARSDRPEERVTPSTQSPIITPPPKPEIQNPSPLPTPPATVDVEAREVKAQEKPKPQATKQTDVLPTPEKFLQLSLKERAIAIIEALAAGGFDVSRCTENQITCVAGNQRGGKGTLIGILAILASALDPSTRIVYFTAGDDVYPFRCHQLICRLNYPDLDGSHADKKVALELLRFLKQLDNAKVGEHKNLMLVVDEAVALSDYLKQEQKQWVIRFLLTRLAKKGLQLFLALHAQNLTSWVGVGNAGGFSSTFKSGARFIGCEATSKKVSPLKSISYATGRYFVADPDEFNKPIEGGEVGVIPEWLKTEINPGTGQPDPVRSLLKYFPELDTSVDAQSQVDNSENVQVEKSPPVENIEQSVVIESPEVSSLEEVEAPESFDTLLDALVTSFKGKGLIKIKRIPSGCNKVRTELKKFEEAKHEAILMLLVERLILNNRAKLPNNRELETKIRTGKGGLEITEEFEIV